MPLHRPHSTTRSPGGYFYTQADGTAGASGLGYVVSDADGIPFLSFYQQSGGPAEWGYPVSHRFIYQGFTVQIFQKAGFQWNPAAGGISFLNIFDLLHEQGFDPQLQAQYSVPPPVPWPQDSGQPFSVVVQNHLAVLEANPALRAAFLANPNWLNINGLPMAPIATYGNVAVLRAQRAVYQQWLQAMPWAAAGQVTVANGGDVAKTLGLWPAWAVAPALSPAGAALGDDRSARSPADGDPQPPGLRRGRADHLPPAYPCPRPAGDHPGDFGAPDSEREPGGPEQPPISRE
ncbi:MAG: hypothetical protein KatS3mg061_2634 [Dehalococcoidia bacterium]|nr:MAG: hypothetical protein KatS3mg061_2634 [Dehalococcoidia bacterium]